MGTFVAERGPDASVAGEVVKDYDEKRSMETTGGKKDTSENELRLKSRQVDAPPSDLKRMHEDPCMKSVEAQRVDEIQDFSKNKGSRGSEAECVVGNKANGSPDTQIHGNGDGDLPSFSIKRLRRIPLRATADNQSATADCKAEPAGSNTGRDKEEKPVMGEGVGNSLEDRTNKAAAANTPVCTTDEKFKQNIIHLDRHVDGATVSGGDAAESRKDVQGIAALESPEEQKKVIYESLPKGLRGDSIPVISPDEHDEELPNGHIGATNPDDAGAEKSVYLPGSILVAKRAAHELPGREEQGQVGLGKDLSGEYKEGFAASYPLPESMRCKKEGEGDRWRNVIDTYSSDPISHMQPPTLSLRVEDPEKENVAPETPKSAKSSSTGTDSTPEKNPEGFGSPTEGEDQDARLPDDKQISEKLDMFALPASGETEALSPPGTVQILPPVLGNSFESPEETTDEEDSPRSSLGFAHPEGDPDLMPLPFSGQIMYPGRYSSPSGPSLLPYSGSLSLRSDSSTTSNRSFAFPILAPPEWNSSPVRMAKADPRYLRRRRRWDGCCFFRLGRSRYKY